MLRGTLAITDLAQRLPVFDGEGIALGASTAQSLRVPALESYLVDAGPSRWFYVVRERAREPFEDGYGAHHHTVRDIDRYATLLRAALTWPLDHVVLEVVRGQWGAKLRVATGPHGTLPLYFTARRSEIAISWDFCELLRAQKHAIDFEIAAHILALDTVYASRQACTGISMLTERSNLYFDGSQTRLTYPAPAPANYSTLALDVDDVGKAFRQLFETALARRPSQPKQWAVELSGGMDSTCVAAGAARSTMPGSLRTAGISVLGRSAIEQSVRVRRIIEALDTVDYRVPIADAMPDLCPEPRSCELEPPLSEFYREAFQRIWSEMAKQGATELFSGIGGDELAPVYEDAPGAAVLQPSPPFAILTPRARDAASTCLPDHAPPSRIPSTSLLAHACRSPYLVRSGLWPVNLLCDPDLIDFCHSLPDAHRLGRKPLRRYCEGILGNDLFRPGYKKETFAAVLPQAVIHHHRAIALQLRDSALAAIGLVDLPAVHALLEHVVATRDEAGCGQLAFFLALERFARQLEP